MVSDTQEVEALKRCNSRWLGSGLAGARVHGPIIQPREATWSRRNVHHGEGEHV